MLPPLAGLLALRAATAGLAEAAADAATEALLGVARALRGGEPGKNVAHAFTSSTVTRCMTFLIMPRNDGVLSTTTDWSPDRAGRGP